ncbi:MAG: hypothetical protein ACI8P3_000607 [Saprospiraceae bacterium]|jgi:hypothetical protein
MIFILLLLPFHFFEANCEVMFSVRSSYHKISSAQQLEQFIQDLKGIACEEAQPYLASAIMQKAEYAFMPTSKLKYFNQGKKLLEKFIQANPNNLEARYVRVLVQSKAPSILGYKDNIKLDIEFIKSHINIADLPVDFQEIILFNVNNLVK